MIDDKKFFENCVGEIWDFDLMNILNLSGLEIIELRYTPYIILWFDPSSKVAKYQKGGLAKNKTFCRKRTTSLVSQNCLTFFKVLFITTRRTQSLIKLPWCCPDYPFRCTWNWLWFSLLTPSHGIPTSVTLSQNSLSFAWQDICPMWARL